VVLGGGLVGCGGFLWWWGRGHLVGIDVGGGRVGVVVVGLKKCWFVESVWCEVDVVCEEGRVSILRRGDVGPRDEVRNQRKRKSSVLVLLFWDRVVAVTWRIGGVGDLLEVSGLKLVGNRLSNSDVKHNLSSFKKS
jgi:hypothetical protein